MIAILLSSTKWLRSLQTPQADLWSVKRVLGSIKRENLNMNKPPKDKPFLGNFGLPWYQMTIWCAVDNKWVTAELQSDRSGKFTWFANEYYAEDKLIDWKPPPKIQEK